jgi:hypothetical protein
MKLDTKYEIVQEDEEEGLGSYWMSLRKGEDSFI